MNMNRGYHGWSRSVRAGEAEDRGLLPLTRAIAVVADQGGVTRKAARAALLAVGHAEAHHTSKYCNLTPYYDPAKAIAYLAAQPHLALLAATVPDWTALIDAAITLSLGDYTARVASFRRVCEELAARTGIAAGRIGDYYYGIWDGDEE